MKLLNVFGLVVGAHLAVFTIIFATPGCRSTGKQKPKPEDTLAAGAPDTLTPIAPVSDFGDAPMMSDADLNPATAPTRVSPVAPGAAQLPAAGGLDAGVRFAPTRPGAASAPMNDFGAPAPTATRATHTVARGESLWSISRQYGISVEELAAANQLARSATLRLGQELSVPVKAAPASASPGTDAANTYEVKAGDTLGAIARRQGTTVAALRSANNLSSDNLRVGQRLIIPGNAAPLSPTAAAPGGAPAASSTPRAGTATYTVQPGDTLGAIAQRHGVRVGDLATLNTITDPAKLRVGQVLRLPANARVTNGTAAPAATQAPAPRAAAPAPAPAPAPRAPTPVEPVPGGNGVTPIEPVSPVEPMSVPVIRID
jgi:LysM repeat protein